MAADPSPDGSGGSNPSSRTAVKESNHATGKAGRGGRSGHSLDGEGEGAASAARGQAPCRKNTRADEGRGQGVRTDGRGGRPASFLPALPAGHAQAGRARLPGKRGARKVWRSPKT